MTGGGGWVKREAEGCRGAWPGVWPSGELVVLTSECASTYMSPTGRGRRERESLLLGVECEGG